MPTLISTPTRITAAGNKPKIIEEFIGRVNSAESRLSIAHMSSPSGWLEPGQTPEFDEFTMVLKGALRVGHKTGVLDVKAGQARSPKPPIGVQTAAALTRSKASLLSRHGRPETSRPRAFPGCSRRRQKQIFA